MTSAHTHVGGPHTRRISTGLALAALLALGACSDMHGVRDRANPGPYGPSRAYSNSDAYRSTVRLHDGSYQALTQSYGVDLRLGDRVHVANGVAQPYR